MIIGATPDTDLKILRLSEGMYNKYKLKRVYYSAYIPINNDKNLPSLSSPPLLRENRLYQADWLLRFYGFKSEELLNESNPNFNNLLDPKCDWALRNLSEFPMEINKADYFSLLRIPGVGVISAKKIIRARRTFNLNFEDLRKLGIVLKRARYFITCNGKYYDNVKYFKQGFITENLLSLEKRSYKSDINYSQLSLFDSLNPSKEDKIKCLTGNI